MKKLLLSLCAISVSAALIAPKIIASNVQTNINHMVEQVNSLPGYEASVVELTSAWFDTNAKVKINFDATSFGADIPAEVAEEIKDFALELDVNANHGPILMSGDKSIGLANITIEVANKELREHLDWAEDLPFYGVNTHISILGKTSYTDKIQPFTANIDEDNIDISFAGYQGKGIFENNEWLYVGQSKDTVIKTENGDLTLGAIDIDSKVASSFIDIISNSFYDSATTFNIHSITFADNTNNEKFSAKNVYVKADSKINSEQDAGNIGITYGVDSIDTSEFKAQDLALAIEVNNISKAFVEAYQQNVSDLSQGSEAEIQAKVMQFVETHLLSFLKAEPELNITSLRGTLAQGSFNSSVNSSLTGITAMPAMLDDVGFWLSHVLANGQLQGDKAVIEYLAAKIMESQLKQNPQTAEMTSEEIAEIAMQQAPQFLQSFIQQGLLIAKDDSYSTTFALKDKALTINNNPIPLPF